MRLQHGYSKSALESLGKHSEFLIYICRVPKLREHAVGCFSCDALDFPGHVLVSLLNHVFVLSKGTELGVGQGPVHERLKELNPWIYVMLFSHVGAEVELVGYVEDLAHKKDDLGGDLVVYAQGLVDEVAQQPEGVLDYGVKRVALFLQLVLVLLDEALQAEEPSHHGLLVIYA